MRARRIGRDVLISGATHAFLKVRGIFLLPLLVKFLGPGEYGAWVQVMITATFVGAAFGLALQSALVRFLSPAEGRRERSGIYATIFTLSAVGGVVGAGVQFLSASLLSNLLLRTREFSSLFAIGSLWVPVYALTLVNKNFFRAADRIPFYNAMDAISVVAEVGAAWAVLVLGFGVVEVIASQIFCRFLLLLATTAIILRWVGWSRPRLGEWKKYVGYSFPLVPAQLSGAVTDRADRFVVGHFLGAAAVGAYSVACMLGRLLLFLSHPIIVVLFPEISRRWDNEDREGAQSLLTYAAKFYLLLSLPLAVILASFGGPIARILANKDVALQVVGILPLVVLGLLLMGLRDIVDQALMMLKRTKISGGLRFSGTIVNLGLNLIWVPRWGILGAALALLLTYGLCLSGSLLFVLREVKIRLGGGFVLKAVLASAILGAIIWWSRGREMWLVGLTTAGGMAAYLVFLLLSNAITSHEIAVLKRMARPSLRGGR